jgi:hypothetical protein
MDAEEDPLGLNLWPPELDRDAVGPALQAFAEIVGDAEDYELIITSDFEEQVRERMEPELAAAFHQDRGAYGKAMAKTLREHDGRVVVVLDVRLFARDAAHPAEATFRHEALHVLLIGNGENTFDSRASLAERTDLSPELVAMAGIAVEEYRVQLAVYDRFPHDPCGSFQGLCATSHDAIHEAAVEYCSDPSKDVQPFRVAVLAAFGAMSTQAGYVAAQLQVGGLPTPVLDDDRLDERMLGEPFKQVIASLRELPPADERVERGELEAAVLRVAGLLAEWLRHIGFEDEPLDDDGGLFFHVYEHEDWVRRGTVGTTRESG